MDTCVCCGPVVSNNITYYTNDTPAVRKYSKCLEAELLKA